MSGESSAYEFIRIEVPCPQCGKNGRQRLADLVPSDTTPCGYCGHAIDLTDQSWRARLTEEAEKFKQIKPTR